MDRPWIAENSAERERLHRIIDGLAEDELGLTLDNGMSVAAALVHLAFWDEHCRAILLAWPTSGPPAAHENLGACNAAVAVLAPAVPAADSVALVSSTADATDAAVEALSPDVAAAIARSEFERLLRRANHRRSHLDQIELTLAEKRRPPGG